MIGERARVLCIGDSITLGLGARGAAYPALLERILEGVSVRVEAINGGRVAHHLPHVSSYVDYRPDVAIVFLGTVDAIPVARKDRRIDLVKLLPRRYQQPGWLQPRPYLPERWWKRNLYAVPESFIRVRVNRAIMMLQGAAPPTPIAELQNGLRELVEPLVQYGGRVVVCGLGPVDGESFPGADRTFPVYSATIAEVARAAGCRFVDVQSIFADARHHRDGWLLLDNLHPNARGHVAIADALVPVVRDALEGR